MKRLIKEKTKAGNNPLKAKQERIAEGKERLNGIS